MAMTNRKTQTHNDEPTAFHDDLKSLGYLTRSEKLAATVQDADTPDAVRQFQTDHQLKPTGIVDEETQKALARALGAAETRLTTFFGE